MKQKLASVVLGAVLSALFTADAYANRACCSPDGTCAMVRERDQCIGGEIQGRGVTCADNPCCEEALAALQQELDQALADLQMCQDNCGPACGDGICECDEEDNCCEDCGCPSCESCVGGTCQSDCGDGTCDPACEDCNSCPTDCAPTCGDGTCECGEDSGTCAEDCAATAFVCCGIAPNLGSCSPAADCEPGITFGPCSDESLEGDLCVPSLVCCEGPGLGFCLEGFICLFSGGVNTGLCPDGSVGGGPCD